MALNDFQKIDTFEKLRSPVQQLANEIYRNYVRQSAGSEFLDSMDAADLTAIGITNPSPEWTAIVDFRNMLNELESFFAGDAVTPVKNPLNVINALRNMLAV